MQKYTTSVNWFAGGWAIYRAKQQPQSVTDYS